MSFKKFFFILVTAISLTSKNIYTYSRYYSPSKNQISVNDNLPSIFLYSPTVKEIFIEGLMYVPKEAISGKLTIEKGKKLDARACSKLVKNIYNLGYFSDIKIEYDYNKNENEVDLYIVLKEKKRLTEIVINGNNNISRETIDKKLGTSKIYWIDSQNALIICEKIKKLYAEKQYYKAECSFVFEPKENGSVSLIINVDEGVYGQIRCVNFKGNKSISRSRLKEAIVCKESWLLGFLDRGGVYRKEMVDFDRYQLENFYQSNGFFEARIKSVDKVENENGFIDITFNISEGPLYKFGKIKIPDDEDLPFYVIKRLIRIDPGQIYSRELIKRAITDLKIALGEKGYMYANILPKMSIDKENNLIDVEFIIDKGRPVFVRTIDIKGNDATIEKVIRREIVFSEGEVLTTKKLEDAKRALETLGYFVPGTGVTWNLKTVDKYLADLDLFLEKAKTGKFYFNVSINGNADAGKRLQVIDSEQREPRWFDGLLTTSKIGLTLQNSNWLGRGLKYYLDGSYANVDKSLSGGLSTNWLFDLPINSGVNVSFRNVVYENFNLATNIPSEKNQGANLQFGFRSHVLDMTIFGLSFGVDNISYTNPIIPKIVFPDDPERQIAFNEVVKHSFEPGTVTWATFSISNDKRNNPFRPTMGYQWLFDNKLAIPNRGVTRSDSNFGFVRTGLDGKWYTPLINEYNIVLYLHGYAGIIFPFPGCNIPYKEMFHVGGPQSVRGYNFGQIGPTLLGSSIGATKSFFVNAEIQCPISMTSGMMGVLFYDGGSAWDTLFNNNTQYQNNENLCNIVSSCTPMEQMIQNNSFRYRHSVGIGFRITSPVPLRVDWGFKLDRDRRLGERLYEVHISMEASY